MKDARELATYSDTISLIVLGDCSVGKTSFIQRFQENRFSSYTMTTTVVELIKKIITIDDINYQIKIWDTIGQEKYRALTFNYYRNADGVIVVFDMSNVESFDHCPDWINSVQEKNINAPIIIIGNKCDLKKKVTKSMISRLKRDYGYEIYECSAKDGTGTNKCFDTIIRKIVKIKAKERVFISDKTVVTNDRKTGCC